MSDFRKIKKKHFFVEFFSRGLSHFRMNLLKPPYQNLRKRTTLARVLGRESQITFWRQIQIFWREKFLVSKMHQCPTLDLANDSLRSSVRANNAENGARQNFRFCKIGRKP